MTRWCRTPWSAIPLLVAAGCSSPTESDRAPTLFVTNPACDGSGCRSIQIRAFVWAYEIPQNPIGLEVLGDVPGQTACLEFPDAWEIVVSEVDPLGTPIRSDTIRSSLDEEIYLTALDWGSDDQWLLTMTESFTPASASGWSLDLLRDPDPDPLPFTARLSRGSRCSLD